MKEKYLIDFDNTLIFSDGFEQDYLVDPEPNPAMVDYFQWLQSVNKDVAVFTSRDNWSLVSAWVQEMDIEDAEIICVGKPDAEAKGEWITDNILDDYDTIYMYDDNSDYLSQAKEILEKEDVRFIPYLIKDGRKKNAKKITAAPADAYHGSPHEFQNFSTENIGTGEGNQVFGWGLYFTNKEEIADYYRGNDELVGVKYKVTLWANKQEELLHWKASFENQPKSVQTKVLSFMADFLPEKNLQKIKKDLKLPFGKGDEQGLIHLNTARYSGEKIYTLVSKKLGSDKAASKFLYSFGIDGIKYLADGGTGGSTGDVYNYVVFNDGDVTVKEVKASRQGKLITASSDEEYLKVAESGDMDTAQRMVNNKAKESGYTYKAFHGTWQGGFTEFKDGSHFSPDKSHATRYEDPSASSTGYSGKKEVKNPQTYSVFLKMNPFDTRTDINRTIFNNEFFRKWGNGAPLDSITGLPDWTDSDDLQEFLEENHPGKFDGLILDEGGEFIGADYESDTRKKPESYVPFSASQIKSADPATYDDSGNIIPLSKRFDPSSNDIRASRQGRMVESDNREGGRKLSELGKFQYLSKATIYRARDASGTTFETGDYVTLSPKFALEHAENNNVYYDETQIVIRQVVSTDDVAEASNPGEYFYIGNPVEGDVAYRTLGDEYEGDIIDISRTKLSASRTGTLVTASSDEEYLKVAESGDTEAIQRMVDDAARNAGYKIKAYHGTTAGDFTEFEGRKWFSANPTKAQEYVTVLQPDGTNDPKLYSVYLKHSRKPVVIDFFATNDDVDTAFSKGKDMVLVEPVGNSSGGRVYVVRDSNQIKSADPITYDDAGDIIPLSKRFDPSSNDIRASRQGRLITSRRLLTIAHLVNAEIEEDELREIYKINYLYDMANSSSFTGNPQRQENILRRFESDGNRIADQVNEDLQDVFGEWLRFHAITEPREWAEARVEMDEEIGEISIENPLAEYNRYAGKVSSEEFMSMFMQKLKSGEVEASSLNQWLGYVADDEISSKEEEIESLDPEEDAEEIANLRQNISDLEDGDYTNLYDLVSESLPHAVENGYVDNDIFVDIYEHMVFPVWYGNWSAQGIDETRETIETIYKELRNAQTLPQKFVAINRALNAAHQTGQMLDYIESRSPEVTKELLNELSDTDVTEWNSELRMMGFKVRSKKAIPSAKAARQGRIIQADEETTITIDPIDLEETLNRYGMFIDSFKMENRPLGFIRINVVPAEFVDTEIEDMLQDFRLQPSVTDASFDKDNNRLFIEYGTEIEERIDASVQGRIIAEIEYPSQYEIGDHVRFYPRAKDLIRMAISDELRFGKIVAVRFTEAKVFYDILDDYYGEIFKDVDSIDVVAGINTQASEGLDYWFDLAKAKRSSVEMFVKERYGSSFQMDKSNGKYLIVHPSTKQADAWQGSMFDIAGPYGDFEFTNESILVDKMIEHGFIPDMGVTASLASDEEYLKAVESEDMDTAQKMVDEAAKSAGYNIGPAYHGTYAEFTEFDGQYSPDGVHWFSLDKDKISGGEAGIGVPTYIGKYYLKAKKVAGWDEYEKLSTGQIYEMGFDAILLDDDYVVFDANQIKSAEPVTHDDAGNVIPLSKRFDPSSNDIRASINSAGRMTPEQAQEIYRKSKSFADANFGKSFGLSRPEDKNYRAWEMYVHPSTKKTGTWQASLFEEGSVAIGDTEFNSPQELLEVLQSYGFDTHLDSIKYIKDVQAILRSICKASRPWRYFNNRDVDRYMPDFVEIETTPKVDLPDGYYNARRYGYNVEIDGKKYATKDGIKNTLRHPCVENIKIENGKVYQMRGRNAKKRQGKPIQRGLQ